MGGAQEYEGAREKHVRQDAIRLGKPVRFFEFTISTTVKQHNAFTKALVESAQMLQELPEIANRRYSGYVHITGHKDTDTFRYSATRIPIYRYGISGDDECIRKKEIMEERLRAHGVVFEAHDTLQDDVSFSFSPNEDYRYLLGEEPGYRSGNQVIETDWHQRAEREKRFTATVAKLEKRLRGAHNYAPVKIFSVGGRSLAGFATPYIEDAIRVSGQFSSEKDWQRGLAKQYAVANVHRQERIIMETPIVSFNVETQHCPVERSDILKTL